MLYYFISYYSKFRKSIESDIYSDNERLKIISNEINPSCIFVIPGRVLPASHRPSSGGPARAAQEDHRQGQRGQRDLLWSQDSDSWSTQVSN